MKIESFKTPYKSFICSDFFSELKIEYVKEFMYQISEWKFHKEAFFEQYEYKVNHKNELFFQEIGLEIKSLLEHEFNVELSDDFAIVFHKLTPGQRISIHNDCPILGYETHRLVLNLNDEYEDNNGGHFYICSERNSESIFKILRPIVNSGFGFEASKNSYHAIGKVLCRDRYSLVFSFYHVGNTINIKKHICHTISEARERFENTIMSEDRSLLDQLDLNEIKTLKSTLLDHLVDTYCILKLWGENEMTARVGLFHSIIGSAKFQLPQEQKAKYLLRNVDIGLLTLVEQYKYFKPESIVKEEMVGDLLLLLKVYIANVLTGKMNCTFKVGEWIFERELLLKYLDLLPAPFTNDLDKIYQLL